jgi:DeoR family transcriptional regulator, fructose operon transcriptional repressor
VTNSLIVASVIERQIARQGSSWAELILTGGSRAASGALVGPTAISALARINPTLLLLSVDGAEDLAGFSTNDILEAEANRAFLVGAQQCAVLVAGSTWGVVGMNLLGPISRAKFVVTDASLVADWHTGAGAKTTQLLRAPKIVQHQGLDQAL